MFTDQKEQAEILKHLLEGGFIKVKDVISWTDFIITKEPEPDFEIIEISLASKSPLPDFLSLIQNIKGEFQHTVVIRKTMKQVLEMIKSNPELGGKVAGWLYSLMLKREITEEEFGIDPYILEDAFELAQKKIWGTEEEALIPLINYLQSQVKKLYE